MVNRLACLVFAVVLVWHAFILTLINPYLNVLIILTRFGQLKDDSSKKAKSGCSLESRTIGCWMLTKQQHSRPKKHVKVKLLTASQIHFWIRQVELLDTVFG